MGAFPTPPMFNVTYINRSSRFLAVQVDFGDSLTSDQMEVVPLASDWAVVSLRRTRSRLVLGFQREGAVKSTVRVPGIGLWLRS